MRTHDLQKKECVVDLGLKDKVVAVAAASKGLGQAVALRVAREGAKVAICSRNPKALQATADDLAAQTGAPVLALEADLTRAQDAKRFIDATADHYGGLDALVCNAGGPPPGSFEDVDDAAWQAAFELTLMSVVRLTRVALSHFKQRGAGRIVNITSVSVKQPIDNLILSNSLRMAVLGLSKSLANEYGGDGVTVNCVCPGYTETKRLDELFQHRAAQMNVSLEDVKSYIAGTVPLGRLGQPQELADLVALLCSDRARYITGAAIQVDGGTTKGYA